MRHRTHRTLKQLCPKRQPEQQHHVYVVLINPAVGKTRHEDGVRDNQKA